MTTKEVLQDLLDYYTPKITPKKAAIYLRMLGGVETAKLQKAADYWMETEKWLPRVNELMETVRKMADVETQAAYDDLSLMFWRAMATWNAVGRGEMDRGALKVYSRYYDTRPNEHQAEELGEWWTP